MLLDSVCKVVCGEDPLGPDPGPSYLLRSLGPVMHQGAEDQNHHHATQEHVVQHIADPQHTREKIERELENGSSMGSGSPIKNLKHPGGGNDL